MTDVSQIQDLLPVCNQNQLPSDDFEALFCKRCHNSSCERSSKLNSWKNRTENWQERYFGAEQLNPEDPRFQGISAQKFVEVEAPRPGAAQEWFDPEDTQRMEVPLEPEPEATSPHWEPPSAPSADVPKPEPAPPNLLNTPAPSGGVMLGGHDVPARAPEKDPWAAPEPIKPGEKLVRPGQKVRF